jgi:two-component system LytT family response regulator
MELKAFIVEDEKHSRQTLINLLEEFCDAVTIIGTADSVETALDLIPKLNPDVVFMDIELNSGTGFDILTQLPELNFEVIFTTAFDQYAIKAVKFCSLDYLLKPIDIEELQEAVNKAKNIKDKESYKKQLETLLKNIKNSATNSKICLATSDGFEFINVSEILYCKAEGSYTSFTLKDNSNLLVSKHLKEYETLLLDQSFMRVHNSFLINLKEVKKFVKSDGGYIIMSNDDTVSISRNKKELFIDAMNTLMD